MPISEDRTAIVVYPGGREDDTHLSSLPKEATETERGDLANIPPVSVKASQLFKNLCKPAVYVENVRKMGFCTPHVEIIRKTPFGAFLNMQPFVVDGRLLADIVRCHTAGDEFIFCGKVVTLSSEDLALILGLPCHGKKIVNAGQKKEGRLYRRFGQHLDLQSKGLQHLIATLVSSKIQEDIEDTVRLWIAYMFAMFLAPKSNQTCPRYLIPYLDDISLLGEMDWSSAIKEIIIMGLPEVASCLRSEEPVLSKRIDKGRRQPTMYGCSAALVVWFLEHSTIRAPVHPNKVPRLLKWYDTQLKIENVQVINLNINQLIEGAIVPTMEERLLITAETIAAAGTIAAVEDNNCCASCVDLRRELNEVKSKLANVEEILNSLLQRDISENKAEEEGEENFMVNKVETCQNNTVNVDAPRIEEDIKAALLIVEADGVQELQELPSVPSLIKRVKKEPRLRKVSQKKSELNVQSGPVSKKIKVEAEPKADVPRDVLIEDDENLIESFLEGSVDHEPVYTNKFNGCVTRKNIYDLINKEMIIDDIIDAGQEFLQRKWVAHPENYHKCVIAPVMTAGMCLTSSSSIQELAGTAGSMIFDGVGDEEKADFRFLFTIINSDNSHWHLIAVDMERKVFLHLNSLKRSPRYKSNAKKWKDIMGPMFHIFCDNEEVTKWPLEEVVDCPSQPVGSLDCGLYCLKYMDCLAHKGVSDGWGFTDEDIIKNRRQLAAQLMREGLDQKIRGAYD